MEMAPDKTLLHLKVAKVLRDKITYGELAPGLRLTERVLCEELKVSRTPLREALKTCLLYTSPSPRDRTRSRMPSSA